MLSLKDKNDRGNVMDKELLEAGYKQTHYPESYRTYTQCIGCVME